MTGWEPDVLPGYWQHTFGLGPDPDGEGDLVATLVRRGEPDRVGRPARSCGARLHRLLLPHRAGRPLRRPRLRRSTRWTCTSAGGRGARARRRTSPPTWRATTPNSSARWRHRASECRSGAEVSGLRPFRRRTDRLAVAGPAAARAVTSPARRITGLVLNSPFLDLHGPAILRTAPDARRRSARCRACARSGWSAAAEQRAATAPPCTGTTAASSTTTWSGSRSAASPSRSAGCTRSAAARPSCTAASTSACPT